MSNRNRLLSRSVCVCVGAISLIAAHQCAIYGWINLLWLPPLTFLLGFVGFIFSFPPHAQYSCDLDLSPLEVLALKDKYHDILLAIDKQDHEAFLRFVIHGQIKSGSVFEYRVDTDLAYQAAIDTVVNQQCKNLRLLVQRLSPESPNAQ
jgi:hypothetical protein